jgi:hypothetical protein
VLTGDKFKNLSLFFHSLLFAFEELLKKAHNSFPREFITLKGVCVS